MLNGMRASKTAFFRRSMRPTNGSTAKVQPAPTPFRIQSVPNAPSAEFGQGRDHQHRAAVGTTIPRNVVRIIRNDATLAIFNAPPPKSIF